MTDKIWRRGRWSGLGGVLALLAGILLPAAEIEDLGIGAKSAEVRSVTAFRTDDGRRLVISRMQDHGKTGYLLLTDVERGETRQFFNPKEVPQGDSFGSILTREGKYLYDQTGGRLLEFDWRTGLFRSLGRPEPAAQHFMCYMQDDAGTVWMGGYPQSTLTAYRPADGTFRNYGRMDGHEKYIFFLAADADGWIYCGIGTARANLVALHPESGERRDLLPEKLRRTGQVAVLRADDGCVYASIGKWSGKCRGGRLIEEKVKVPPPSFDRAARSFSPNSRRYDFGDGSTVVGVDVEGRTLTVAEADGRRRTLPFPFVSGGLRFTSLGPGPDGKVYGSTSHPLRLVEVDVPGGGRLIDHGGLPVGGNLCAIDADDRSFFACEYAGGRMWRMDKARPLMPTCRMLLFGGGPDELERNATVRDGRLVRLATPPLLYAVGEGERPEFRFRLNNPEAGKRWLNLQFYRNANYGAATVEFCGERRTVELESAIDAAAPMLTFGPVELAAGTHEFKVTPAAGSAGRKMFGIMAAALEPEPRKTPAFELNPRIVGRWKDLVTRPRAILVHPDGRSVVMSGFANYGLTGGGFGIYDRISGETRAISEWLPGHSCIALAALSSGELVGGTSVEAPGGGREQATRAALFRLSWPEGKVLESVEISGSRNIVAAVVHGDRLIAATGEGELLIAEPGRFAGLLRKRWPAAWGKPPRKALLKTPDGRVFLLLSRGIAEVDPVSGECRLLVGSSSPITAGGAVQGNALYFARGLRVARWSF